MKVLTEITTQQVTAMLLGAATGDAFGVPFEFLSSEAVVQYSLGIMHGADQENTVMSHWGAVMPAGTWSKDTSMTVATMESIIRTGGELNFTDLMNQFVAWLEQGKYCAIDRPFGLGQTVGRALGPDSVRSRR
ncbi:ADP-ribosylglycohydrolase family protein [Corynebacterium cystitidis]|uniref:ADP-ribosylglycohydrolase family protein n=1 Tax=Corynebacterium cystitidis TaxID=35757 RepID=UPI00211E556E|nr:ADP-ribosylglycohydrolase family protein [Corynebacterium cystitidis]